MKLKIITLFVLSILTGCASVQQAFSGYASAAAVSIDATNDNAIKVWRYQMCQTPVSAALRNPDVVPAIKAMCMPAASAAPVATLLDTSAK